MNRQEICNNIKILQERISDYMLCIRDTENKISNLNRNIRSYENQLYDIQNDIRNCENKVNEMNSFKKKLEDLQNRFAERQQIRIDAFNRNFSKSLKVNFMGAYVSDMKNMLTGSEYWSVYNGLTELIRNTVSAIQNTEVEISGLRRNVRNLEGEIVSNQTLIRSSGREIDEARYMIKKLESEIKFLNEQLKYAT